MKLFKGSLVFIFMIIIIIFLITTFFYSVDIVDGSSMSPVLFTNDRVLINKTFIYKGYDHGDIVICKFPKTGGTYIKRVIGKSGDVLECVGGRVYRNKEDITDIYWPEIYIKNEFEKITVPENAYYLIGDNVNISKDSRQFGCVKQSLIIGKIEVNMSKWKVI